MKCMHMYIKTHVEESSDLNYSWQPNIGSNSKVNQQCNGLPTSEHLKNKQQLHETIYIISKSSGKDARHKKF